MFNSRKRTAAFTFGLLLVVLARPVVAQLDIGSLTGVVTDPQGGDIQGAQVTAVEASTGATHSATTNSDGVYALLSLPPGTYDLTIRHEGFQTLTEHAIPLASGENKKRDVRLLVGTVAQQVEVTGVTPALETREGAYSLEQGTKTLEQLPLEESGAKRNAAQYLKTLPSYQQGAGFQNQIGGSVGGYSEVYVDGTPMEVNAAAHGLMRNFFSPEAVSELKVVTTPMADLGNTGGVAISFITKPGTNQIHGSVYDFFRNTALDANCAQFCPGPKPVDHQGEYGFQLGGPVYIPHVYDGRNKTFWWFNWGHFYYHYSVGETFYGVPTNAMKGGNFSSFLGAQIGTDAFGNPVYKGEIFNPNTTTTVGGQLNRTPYSVGSQLNMVPTTMFSSVASKYQAFFPGPNNGNSIGSNYASVGATGTSPDTYYQIDIDQIIGSKDRLTGAYWKDYRGEDQPFTLPAELETFVLGHSVGHFVHMNWTHTFTPTLVNEASFGFDRNYSPVTSPAVALKGAATVGQVNALGPCTPGIAITGGYMTSPGGINCYQSEGDNNFAINDNWSLAKGKHLIKWGFNLIRFNANFPFQANFQGNFRAAETSLPNSPNCPNCATQTGNSYASFLVGAVDNGQAQGYHLSSPRIIQYGFYGQDEFKVTPKLTLTFALRWDAQPFPVERHDRYSTFVPTQPNPGCNGCPGAVAFFGNGPGTLNRRGAVPNEYLARNFGPKLGFAYQIRQNTIIRGAATLAWAPVNQTMAGFANEYQQGYFPTFSTSSPDGISPAFSLDKGYPFPPGVPPYNNFNPAVANGSATAFFGRTSDRAPSVLNAHFAVEHQFPGQVVVGLHYNGAYVHGIINQSGAPANVLNYGKYASYGQTCLVSDIAAQKSCPVVVPLPYPGYKGTVEQALRPFPQYGDILNESATTGTTTYSAGQVTAKKNFSNGLSFLVGYTYSRQMSNLNNIPGFFSSPAQNAYNPNAEKAPAYADMTHQLLLSYTYALPVGRGKTLDVNSKVLDAVVGGWSVAGVHTYQSGLPLGVTSNTVLFSMPQPIATPGISVRPNMVPGQAVRTNISCSSFNPAGGNVAVADTYLNAAAFVMPPALHFGNAPRAFSNVRSCPFYNENFTLYKNFGLTEKVNLRFGVDFFNIFNRHVWDAPDTNVEDANFGKILGLNGNPRAIQLNARVSF
jgi:hypothetical protein